MIVLHEHKWIDMEGNTIDMICIKCGERINNLSGIDLSSQSDYTVTRLVKKDGEIIKEKIST